MVLYPAPDRRVVDAEVSFRHEFLQVTIAEREPEIPSDAEDDDLLGEVPAAEKCRAIALHLRNIS